jgi:calcineurin-like phosphoesterase family protein
MNKVKWITSDWHLGDDRLELLGLPFKTVNETLETLIKNHNDLVDKNDWVIVNGDTVYQKAPEFVKEINKFNGKKILIRGNHDKPYSDDELSKYFDKIIEEGSGISFDLDGIPCYVTHYPTQGKKDKFNLVGHIHGAWKYQLNMFNVGVFTNNYKPVNMNSIKFHYDAICKYYDEDVWAAYNEINSDYVGKRGKKGRYYNK